MIEGALAFLSYSASVITRAGTFCIASEFEFWSEPLAPTGFRRHVESQICHKPGRKPTHFCPFFAFVVAVPWVKDRPRVF